MTQSDESIFALLTEANPFPDVDDLPGLTTDMPPLAVIERGRDPMQTHTPAPPSTPPQPPTRRIRRWVPALAGAAVIIVAVIVGVLAFSQDSEPAGPTEDVTTTVGESGAIDTPSFVDDQLQDRLSEAQGERDAASLAALEAKILVAEQALADWRDGDVDAFFAHFGETGQVIRIPATDPLVRSDLAFYMALGQQPRLVECSEYFGTTIRCATSTTDALSGDAGMLDVDWIFTISDGSIANVEWYWEDQPGSLFNVIHDMVAWVEIEHPDRFAAVFAPPGGTCDPNTVWNCHTSWLTSPEAAAELLLLGPEFLATYQP